MNEVKSHFSSGLISIIVPVYNREEQIHYCLDSLISTDYKLLEIIIIDDGSTDETARLCKQYVERDIRVRYIYQINKGVSAARNHGISVARGEWIAFADSDDVVLPHHFDLVRDYGNDPQYDLMITGSARSKVDELKWRFKDICAKEVIKRSNATEFLFGDYDPYRNGFCFIWNKIFRHEIMVEYKIRFDESMSMDEDQEFVCRYLKYAKGVVYDPSPSYLTLYWPTIHHLGVYLRTPENYLYNIEHCYKAIVDLAETANNDNIRKFGATFAIDRTITRILTTYTKSDYKNKFIKRELYDFTVRMIVPFFKCVNDSAGIVLSKNYKNIYFMLRNNLPRFAMSYCRAINVLRELKQKVTR